MQPCPGGNLRTDLRVSRRQAEQLPAAVTLARRWCTIEILLPAIGLEQAMGTTSQLGWADALLLIAGYLALGLDKLLPSPAWALYHALESGAGAGPGVRTALWLESRATAARAGRAAGRNMGAQLPGGTTGIDRHCRPGGARLRRHRRHSRAAERRVGDVFRSFRHLAVVWQLSSPVPCNQPPFRARPGRAGMGAGQRLARGGWPLLDR